MPLYSLQGGEVSEKSDIWALGLVLIEALTGEYPLVAKLKSEHALMHFLGKDSGTVTLDLLGLPDDAPGMLSMRVMCFATAATTYNCSDMMYLIRLISLSARAHLKIRRVGRYHFAVPGVGSEGPPVCV